MRAMKKTGGALGAIAADASSMPVGPQWSLWVL